MRNLFLLVINLIILISSNNYCQDPKSVKDGFVDHDNTKSIDSVLFYNDNKYEMKILLYPSNVNLDFVKNFGYEDGKKVTALYKNNYLDLIVYKNSEVLFKKTFSKGDFSKLIDKKDLMRSILNYIGFRSIDGNGLNYQCSICFPYSDICDEISLLITFTGQYKIKLLEEKEEGE
jgi:hypothetical protein